MSDKAGIAQCHIFVQSEDIGISCFGRLLISDREALGLSVFKKTGGDFFVGYIDVYPTVER